MCTAILHKNDNLSLLSRTLDLECSYAEQIVITPRGYRFPYIYESVKKPLSLIGIAHVESGVPLYYDAMNECGLMGAALNFPGNAKYGDRVEGRVNLASFELLPYVLSASDSLSCARELLSRVNITLDAFSSALPPTPLHWIFADSTGAITIEADAFGYHVYENPFGVLTNNPPFPYHKTRMADFMFLDSFTKKNELCPQVNLRAYSRGMGAIGLPGDFSSSSRFVRSVFLENHTKAENTPMGALRRAFHIADNISVPCGAVKSERGDDVYTVYTAVLSPFDLTYYVSAYGARSISALRLTEDRKCGDKILSFTIPENLKIEQIN